VATVRSKQSLIPTRTTIPARDTSHPAGFEDWNKGTWSVSLNAPAGGVSWKYAHFVARQAGTGYAVGIFTKNAEGSGVAMIGTSNKGSRTCARSTGRGLGVFRPEGILQSSQRPQHASSGFLRDSCRRRTQNLTTKQLQQFGIQSSVVCGAMVIAPKCAGRFGCIRQFGRPCLLIHAEVREQPRFPETL